MLPARNKLIHRFAGTNALAPASYDKKTHSVEAVLSAGAAVKRSYGVEVLRISPQAVDLTRMEQGGIPFLDHHSQAGIDQVLGRITNAWIVGGALIGRIQFNQTKQGQKAEGMVARGEIAGVSAGYRVDQWEISDADGAPVDESEVRFNDEDLTFTAIRWTLFEASLVGVPADGTAMIRSMASDDEVRNVLARMQARQAIVLGHDD